MNNVKRNFIYSSIYQIYAIIVPIITTPYLSRVLGAEGVGQYAYAYSISYYFSLFVILGLMTYGNRAIAIVRDDRKRLSVVFWNIYFAQIFFGVIISILYFVFLLYYDGSNRINIIMYGVIFSECFNITWLLYGMEEFRTTTVRDIIIKIFSIILIFFCVKKSGDVWKYALIRSAGYVVSQLSLWPIALKRIPFVKPSIVEIKSHIKPNLVLFIPTIAVSIYKTMDKIMLGAMSGELEVGLYESSEKIIQVPMALIIALGTVMMPHMSNLLSNNELSSNKGIEIIRSSEHFMIAISSGIGFGIMALAKDFVPLFYGEGYEKCVALFYILLPSCVFLAFANVIRTQFLIPRKCDKKFIISLFVGAIVNLCINFLLISSMKSIGVAIGTLCAEMSVCIVQILFVCREIPIIDIAVECSGYIFISILMFLSSRRICINVQNDIFCLILKIFICGTIWLVGVSIYVWILKKFLCKNIVTIDVPWGETR